MSPFRSAPCFLLALLAVPAAFAQGGPITIGPGPLLGAPSGVAYHEDLMDWAIDDVRRIDPAGDARRLGDGEDFARDLIAFYSRRTARELFLRVDLLDLGFGSEGRALDLAVLVDFAPGGQAYLPHFLAATTAHPWEFALVLRDGGDFVAYDADWSVLSSPRVRPSLFRGASFRSDLDGCEFGIDLDLLRRAGWDGHAALRFQVCAWKDGSKHLADAVGEARLDDGRLDEQIPADARAGTAKYAVILHGNQSLGGADWIAPLIRNERLRTPEGRPTGYARALDTHETFRVPANIHLSGSLIAALAWARHPDPRRDGPTFLRRLARFVDGDPRNGEGSFLGGVFSEHILPYFEGSGVTEASARLMDEALRAHFGLPRARVFWSPERVLRGSSFADIRAAGYEWTVIDQANHLERWFGAAEARSRRGHKINRIHGVNCFVINDDADQLKFANTDGGTALATRRQLVAKALDPDQQQLIVVFDDWEAYAGRSFTSFGLGNDNPDNYERHIRWLANHPWVQVVRLDEVTTWGWTPVERGRPNGLPLETYHWLQHACERSYDHWYYGSPQEESFRDIFPLLARGRRAHKPFGEVWTPGTLLHDVWADVRRAPPGNLRRLAELVYSCMVFETAWHDEDQNDYHARTPSGDYLHPDTSYDRVADWALGLHGHVREASVVAAAAEWAAHGGAGGTVAKSDLDHDGEEEFLLRNERLFAVLEDDGGRLVALFVRDPASGEGYQVLGAFPANPGSDRNSEREGERPGAQQRVSGLKDLWASGPATSAYVNAPYAAARLADGWRLRSADGRIEKTVRLRPGSARLEVRYRVDPNLGTLYVRNGLSPAAGHLVFGGQELLSEAARPGRFALEARAGRRRVWVAVTSGNARLDPAPSDGSPASPRAVALTHQVELSGRGSFAFSIEAGVR